MVAASFAQVVGCPVTTVPAVFYHVPNMETTYWSSSIISLLAPGAFDFQSQSSSLFTSFFLTYTHQVEFVRIS